jgi:hypothetical protein
MDDDYEEEEVDEGLIDDEELDEELEEPDEELDEEHTPTHKFVNPTLQAMKSKDNAHKIIRIVPEDMRITSEIIQLPEMVEAIGIRCTEISRGSPVFTTYEGLSNEIDIAKKEFYDRQSPLILQRIINVNDNVIDVEEWRVREMTFPTLSRELVTTKQKFTEPTRSKETNDTNDTKPPKKEFISSPKKPTAASSKKPTDAKPKTPPKEKEEANEPSKSPKEKKKPPKQ